MASSRAIEMNAAHEAADVRTDAPSPAEQPSAVSAAERAVEAAQRIAVERIELVKLELQEALGALAKRTGLMMAAGLIAILGWSGLAVAAALLLAERMPLPAAIAAVGAVHVLAGIGLGAYAGAAEGQRKTP